MRSDHFIFKELPFFMPKASVRLLRCGGRCPCWGVLRGPTRCCLQVFIKDPRGQRGIHCRFGMSAVIAENHYDGSRNVIGLFGGRRRYILAHPNQCQNM